ncbi:MAG: hypothetical protein IJS58_07260 [Bacilli bacterium]|nr:hypothetical protein [Bacilli bacterium]
MNNLFKDLNSIYLNVYNDEDSIVSCAFIINFIDKKDSKLIRPFLIMNESCFINNDSVYIMFDTTNKGISSKHKLTLNKSDFFGFLIDDNSGIISIPLAQTINDLNSKEIIINFKGISDDLIPTYDILEKIQSIDNFAWAEFDNSIDNKVWKFKNNSTFIEGTDDVYFENNDSYIGTPLFLVDSGSYVQDGTLFLGQRVLFMGAFYKTSSKYIIMFSSRKLIEKIKTKYKFE